MKNVKSYDNFEEINEGNFTLRYDFVDNNIDLIQDTISKISNPEYLRELKKLNAGFKETKYKAKIYRDMFQNSNGYNLDVYDDTKNGFFKNFFNPHKTR